MPLNIALDGPAGAGKSTIAKALAARLKILYLDTGALYRAVACAVKAEGIHDQNQAAVAAALPGFNIEVDYQNGAQMTLLNGLPLGESLRTPDISQLASVLSAQAAVREHLLMLQRQIAATHSCVLDGRDIGTHVLPACRHKFFITASIEERARRRWIDEGQIRSIEAVQADIAQRDERDTHRTHAPLRQAPDAIGIDTTHQTIEEGVDAILSQLKVN